MYLKISLVVLAAVLASLFQYREAPHFEKKKDKKEQKVSEEQSNKHEEVIHFEATYPWNLNISIQPAIHITRFEQSYALVQRAIELNVLESFYHIKSILLHSITINAP